MTKSTIHVLNGPGISLLETRKPGGYAADTLADVEALCRCIGGKHG